MIIVIKTDRIITGPDDPVLEDHQLVIEDGIIASIDRNSKGTPPGAKVIDIGDRTILPGLIDCHVHTGLDGSTHMEKTLLELFPFHVIKAGQNVVRDLEAGFTTLRCMGDKGYLDIGLKQAIEQGVMEGPRLVTCGHAITITGGHADIYLPPDIPLYHGFGVIADGPDEVRKAVRQQIKFGAQSIKLMATGGLLSKDEPGSQQLSSEELQVAVEEAHRTGKKVAVHAQGTRGIKNCIKAGVDTIEHGFYLDQEAIQMMLDKDVYYCPTHQAIKSQVDKGENSGLPEYAIRKGKLAMKASVKSLQMAIQSGVKIVCGTDAGTPFNPHGGNAGELELMVKHGMTTNQALASATTVAAELLGLSDKVGVLSPGKFADLIAVKGDPLLDITVLKSVDFVMKDGVVLKDLTG